jgi:hypothetical protein
VTDVTKYDSPAEYVLFYRKRIEAVFNNHDVTAPNCAAGQKDVFPDEKINTAHIINITMSLAN